MKVKFTQSKQTFNANFDEVNNISDGGYERGYDKGYEVGYADGLNEPKLLGALSKYIKIIAKPQTATSFTIENPLGGIAKKISVIMKPYQITSKRRCRKYIADYDMRMAVGEYSDTDSSVLYNSKLTTGTVGNGEFKITEGKIILYRYNPANAWEEDCEYEVEIYE